MARLEFKHLLPECGIKGVGCGAHFFFLSFFVFVALGVELIHLCLLDKCFLYSKLHPKPKTVAVLYAFSGVF